MGGCRDSHQSGASEEAGRQAKSLESEVGV